MTTHLGLMALFSFFVALVFAVIGRDAPRDQLTLWLKFFGGFIGAGLVLGWIMYPLPF
ncbi:MAG: hypothetical protein IT177_02120 [Acidobacteria bacterium]|nr:hypothetical protein [Acidobacteriota bacterium]